MPRAAHNLKNHLLCQLALMLACALLCTLLGQGHSTRQLNKWVSAASSTSISQLTARAFDLGTDGVVALEPQTYTAGLTPLTQALEVKFLLIQWGALLYRTPVLGWTHRLQKLEDGWRTGGLNRWLSLLDFAVETLLIVLSKSSMGKGSAQGVDYSFNPFNLTRASFSRSFSSRASLLFAPKSGPNSRRPARTLRQVFPTLLVHPLRPF